MNIDEMNEKLASFLHLKFKELKVKSVFGVWVSDDASENVFYNKSFNESYYTIPFDSDWSFLIELIKIVRSEIKSIKNNNLKISNDFNTKHNLDMGDDDYDDSFILKNAKYEAVEYPIEKSLETLDKLQMHKAVYDAVLLLTS